MKRVLLALTETLENTMATLGALELALLDHGHLAPGDIDLFLAQPRAMAKSGLVNVRYLISTLPES